MRLILAVPVLLITGALSAFAAIDPALLALVPPGSKLVAGVQLTQARSSQFGQYLLSHAGGDEESFQQFTEQTGFDPRHDLDEIVFATTGPSAENHHTNFAILARGSFDRNRILGNAKARGALVEAYQGTDLIFEKHGNHPGPGFAFLDGGIAVMADRATLRQIVGNRTSSAGLDPTLQDQLLKVSAGNDGWFVSSMSGLLFAHHVEHETKQTIPQAQALESILQSSGGVHFGDVVGFSFEAVTRSPQHAVSLADVLRLGGSMVQMQRQNDPRAAIVASAVDKMAISNDGTTVHATFSMTEEELERLVDMHRETGSGASLDPGVATKPTAP
jgi:hypothetical protein